MSSPSLNMISSKNVILVKRKQNRKIVDAVLKYDYTNANSCSFEYALFSNQQSSARDSVTKKQML